MKKRLLWVSVLALVLIAGAALVGCGKKPESISIANDRITGDKMYIVVGSYHTLGIKTAPSDADVSKASWSTSDPKVIRVDGGVINGRSVGTATVTVSVGSLTASVTVNVSYGMQLPDASSSSTNSADTVSDKAFDRNLSTVWKSDASQSLESVGTEFVQADFLRPRELNRFVLYLASTSHKPDSFEIWGSDSADFATKTLVKRIEGVDYTNYLVTSADDTSTPADDAVFDTSTIVIETELNQAVFFSHYRFAFPRTTTVQNMTVKDIEMWTPTSLTK